MSISRPRARGSARQSFAAFDNLAHRIRVMLSTREAADQC
jgi:hypothetical protein